eukprot:923177-Amphidinium_carterae.1
MMSDVFIKEAFLADVGHRIWVFNACHMSSTFIGATLLMYSIARLLLVSDLADRSCFVMRATAMCRQFSAAVHVSMHCYKDYAPQQSMRNTSHLHHNPD